LTVSHRLWQREENQIAESIYSVIDLVGTNSESWEKAAAAVVSRTSKTLRDLRRRQ
jgi:flavin-binding protein dodecin